MTTFQKVIKYLAMAFAICLIVSIFGGILGTVGFLGGFFEQDTVQENAVTYPIHGDITALDIQISAADFTIKQADTFSVESNLKHLTVSEQDGTLRIEETKKLRMNSGAFLTLCIPADAVLDKAKITTGAGKLSVETLSANDLDLELGAGEVDIRCLNAAVRADIDGGAGKLTIADGTLHDLDLDMGVGQLNLTCAVLGNSDLGLGVGESNITLIGSRDDYCITAEKGIGDATIDGRSISNEETFGSGANKIEVDGGVGAIRIDFKSAYTA